VVGAVYCIKGAFAEFIAAGCEDMAGNQWEWTASAFAPYRGFRAAPYRGYSETYFDRRHRVVKGGSWATRATVLRSSFRN